MRCFNTNTTPLSLSLVVVARMIRKREIVIRFKIEGIDMIFVVVVVVENEKMRRRAP